ncbi:MAG: GGDEF domain-containing response regulator [Phyllobacteriaceae bacterium]|nr:GGDEF domain-containing response regulator [Phyllobacteriaceae bacterium]MBA90676.1 GGDEF domain-containing response regulator [Phyllobacteriaceae bacterium]
MNTATAHQIPADSQALPASQAEAAPRILVVDDVADNRDILTRRLVRRGFEVVEAAGGQEALMQVDEQPFDVILLDIMMPDLSGNEVLRRIRERFSNTELPVIMVTAKSQSEDVVESLNLGANDYVTKPVDFAVAIARINSHVEAKKAHDRKTHSARSLEARTEELNRTLTDRETALRSETSRRKVSEEKLHFLAYHDSLTELLNRQGFRDALHHAIDEMPVNDLEPALLFIDLDGFKAVNDLFGHATGDKLLRSVGDRLRGLVPEQFDIARLGGDEFAVITRFASQPEASMELAEMLVQELGKPFQVDGTTLNIGASCGVARASHFSSDLDGLIKGADLAMYHAKSNGRGGAVLFEARMLEEQEEKRQLESDLRLAVQHSQFELFYQPLIDIKSRAITGFEALIRWPHPTRGLMSPEIFIPLAEETGLINQLGAWVLREACKEARTWPDDIKVAVNLSPLQFESPSLLSTLINALAASGLNPNRLELEITESALLGNEGKNVQTLQAIRELGVRVSMDDFGTGYSSLAYLKNFQFDKIKIDRRFVQGLENNVSDAAIVEAIINLSRNIGVGTTAEGIETESQLRAVIGQGCREGQGYLFSRPLTSRDARDFIGRFVYASQ